MKKKAKLPEYSVTFKVVFRNRSIRHIRMSSTDTMYRLHEMIYAETGFWEDMHLHGFFLDNVAWSMDCIEGSYDPDDPDIKVSDREVRIADLNFYIGKQFLYIFDYGDEWRFNITVIAIDMEHTDVPTVVFSKGEGMEQYPSLVDEE